MNISISNFPGVLPLRRNRPLVVNAVGICRHLDYRVGVFLRGAVSKHRSSWIGGIVSLLRYECDSNVDVDGAHDVAKGDSGAILSSRSIVCSVLRIS